jgi:hypothetical protein
MPFLNLEYFYNLIYRFLIKPMPDLVWPPPRGSILYWLVLLLLVAEVLMVVGIVWLLRKVVSLRKKEAGELKLSVDAIQEATRFKPKNERWEKVERYLAGNSPAEWKLAIIEADNILDELVKKFPSAKGDNLGERLKSIEPSDFTTLSEAWEAHKIRNRIAHESDFTLTQREAREVISLFQKVFAEFDYLS